MFHEKARSPPRAAFRAAPPLAAPRAFLDHFGTNGRFAEFLDFLDQKTKHFQPFPSHQVFFGSFYGNLGRAWAGPKTLEENRMGEKCMKMLRFFCTKIAKIAKMTKIAKIAKLAEMAENAKVAKITNFGTCAPPPARSPPSAAPRAAPAPRSAASRAAPRTQRATSRAKQPHPQPTTKNYQNSLSDLGLFWACARAPAPLRVFLQGSDHFGGPKTMQNGPKIVPKMVPKCRKIVPKWSKITPKPLNASTPKRPNAPTPQRPNAHTPKRPNAPTPQQIENSKIEKRFFRIRHRPRGAPNQIESRK